MSSTSPTAHGARGCCAACDEAHVRLPKLVAYSLVSHEGRRGEHALQFELSLTSLRTHSPAMPAVLFSHGPLPPEMAALCHRFAVMVADQGPCHARIAAFSDRGAAALAQFPLVHKSLNFAELAAAGVGQVLCCDLDTMFLGDVDLLFERYAGRDVVGREEVHSGRSMHGADATFIDERLLAGLAGHLGRAVVAPLNTGVLLYSHRAVERLVHAMPVFLDDVWRLLCGMTVVGYPNAGVADDPAFEWMPAVRRYAHGADLERALPYPSSNAWLAEEVAWWLALGSAPDLSFGDFSPLDVAQSNEFLAAPPGGSPWTVCHYFSRNLGEILGWLHRPSFAVVG